VNGPTLSGESLALGIVNGRVRRHTGSAEQQARTTTTPMQILIITDEPLTAIGLQNTLAAGIPGRHMTVHRSSDLAAPNGLSKYGLVLLDLETRRAARLDALSVLRRRHPSAAVAVVTGAPCDQEAQTAAHLGARAYLSKSSSLDQLGAALACVACA